MKATLNVSIQDEQILVNSPETGYHESLPNVLLIDRSRNMLIGVGVTLADAQSRSPETWEAKKDVLQELPVFSNTDFRSAVTYSACMYFNAGATLNTSFRFMSSVLGLTSVNWNLQLQGYEQIPKLERDRFEYEVLTNLTLRRGKIKQLIINGCLVTKLNLELVRNGKKFHRQEKLANLLIGTLSLLSMLFLMALSFDLIVYTFPSRSYVIIAGDCHLRR